MSDTPEVLIPAPPGKLRGARPTPRHKLLAAEPYRPAERTATPPQFALVPRQLSMWGNSQYGDCVSAEEAFAKACASPEIFVPEQTVIDWARRHGWLDGAELGEVMDAMAADGFVVNGKQYNDGGKLGVDYGNESLLQAAISDPAVAGPVKIAIDANALPGGAGNASGWYATGGGRFPNTDHCVAISGYGPASYLFQQLGFPVPSALQASQQGYLLYTWNTIGFVDHAWIMGTCVEAWVRKPTTPGVGPPPPPPPPPGPTPTPAGNVLTLTTALPAGSYTVGPTGGLSPAQVSELQQAAALIQQALGTPAAQAQIVVPPWLVALLKLACGLLPAAKGPCGCP